MLKMLHRKIKVALYRRDYERMIAAAARGDYSTAATLALMLGEQALVEQYKTQAHSQIVLRYSSAIVVNEYRRAAMATELRATRMN